ncbi:MAG: AbrB/MazE/SpoVT family DNA-binding domain-containing protein [Candidatus Lambdaproteobacteria bacterium]|nr:AbrB/MazE/SpoVT family DNA-binding domain-containing protein [Candidatus Lambdaproteobacteria bacterium]
MRTATSKLTRKYQATIPQPVRAVLHLQAGDTVAFEIEDDRIRLRKARPIDLEFARALEGTLDEWSGEADEDAYRGL